MKTKYYFVILLIVHIAYNVHGECCHRKYIKFVNNDPAKSCSDYGGDEVYPKPRCGADICGNGEPPREGFYCGVGPCNMFGCNCDGGCIEGDARKSFEQIHGNSVSDVHIVWNRI